jgi:hypothetical protein
MGTEPDVPDEMFADQLAALTTAGFSASLCPDEVLAGGRPLRGIPAGSTVVYRGWMVTPEEYVVLAHAIETCGARPLTSPAEYVATHYLPNWYPLLADLTPETRVFPEEADIETELRVLGWGTYFIKDYVKSLKTAPGPLVREPSEAPALIAQMKEYRGRIEGGICVRRVEEFEPESERRYFILHGAAHAPEGAGPVPEIVRQCAERISSPFFSADVVRRRDGQLRVVEVGDGQVSDLVGWSPAAFSAMWRQSGPA